MNIRGKLIIIGGAVDKGSFTETDLDKNAAKMSAQEFAALSGEAHVMLGDEARRQFDDFHIVELPLLVSNFYIK